MLFGVFSLITKLDKTAQILTLIKPFVKSGKILPRTYEQISENISDFVILKNNSEIVACAGLKKCEDNIGEIYALAVAQNNQKQGFSTKLLKKIIQRAQQLEFRQIFALTKYNSKWFIKNGFTKASVKDLPKKRQIIFDFKRDSEIFFKDVN